MNLDGLISEAIKQAKAGNRTQARKLLSQAITENPSSSRAWYLLSQVLDDKDKSIYCLKKVLELEPGNPNAQEKLNQIYSAEIQPLFQPDQSQREIKQKKNKSLPWLIGLAAISVICFCIIVLGLSDSGGVTPSILGNTIVYRVEGSGTQAFIDYFNEQGGSEQIETAIPWSKSFTMDHGTVVSLVAQSQEYGKTISCIIELNGKEWKRSTSRGDFVVVTCSGWIGLD